MAGDDSPTEKKEEFNFGRSTPPPTTSYVAPSKKLDQGDIATAAEPPESHKEDKEKDKETEKDKDDKDDIDVMRPGANPGYNPDEIRSKADDDGVNKRDKREDGDRDGDGPGKIIDGSDLLDGQWIPPKDTKHHQDEEEDDNCTVKCLYYTMQCCECSIS